MQLLCYYSYKTSGRAEERIHFQADCEFGLVMLVKYCLMQLNRVNMSNNHMLIYSEVILVHMRIANTLAHVSQVFSNSHPPMPSNGYKGIIDVKGQRNCTNLRSWAGNAG